MFSISFVSVLRFCFWIMGLFIFFMRVGVVVIIGKGFVRVVIEMKFLVFRVMLKLLFFIVVIDCVFDEVELICIDCLLNVIREFWVIYDRFVELNLVRIVVFDKGIVKLLVEWVMM